MAGGYENIAVTLDEQAASATPVAGQGKFWIRSDAPNTPMFTDDGDNDRQLAITLGTEVDTSTGATEYDIAVPSGVQKVDVNFNQVDLNGTDELLIQLGDSGGIETSGYLGTCAYVATTVVRTSWTSGCLLTTSRGTSNAFSGIITFELINASNQWIVSANLGRTDSQDVYVSGGGKALSAELTTVRITSDGSNTFDGGTVNVQYE